MGLTVAKVGGSLFDLPDLRGRLLQWRAAVPGPVLFVPGGGTGADIIRRLDQVHGLGEEAAHWLALRVLSLNAHLLAGLTGATVESLADEGTADGAPQAGGEVSSPERKRRRNNPRSLTLRGGNLIRTSVVDPHTFCIADDGRPGSLPHTWDVTSDSVAARVAEVAGAELVLLKSVDLAIEGSWDTAAADGLVDPTFGSIVGRARLRVTWVNLRQSTP